MQADAYGGYDGIYLGDDAQSDDVSSAQSGTNPHLRGVIEVACWAHRRRYWHKTREKDPVRVHHVLAIIGRLYEIERACADQASEFRKAKRLEHAVPLLESLDRWLSEQQLLPKSLIGKAATYTRAGQLFFFRRSVRLTPYFFNVYRFLPLATSGKSAAVSGA